MVKDVFYRLRTVSPVALVCVGWCLYIGGLITPSPFIIRVMMLAAARVLPRALHGPEPRQEVLIPYCGPLEEDRPYTSSAPRLSRLVLDLPTGPSHAGCGSAKGREGRGPHLHLPFTRGHLHGQGTCSAWEAVDLSGWGI